MQLRGTIPPMATPIHSESGEIDHETLESYTEFLTDGGVHGLFPCGSTGEFTSLTAQQRRSVIDTVVRSADVPVLAGCGDTSIGDVSEHVDAARDAGADAAVVVTPYYLDVPQDGLQAYFEQIADRADLPVILYNIPSLTGHPISLDVATALAEHDNVIGLKDTSGDMSYHYKLIQRTPGDFDVLQGLTSLAVASLDIGSDGLVAGPANVFPEALVETYDAHCDGNRERAGELMRSVVAPLTSTFDGIPTASAIKYLLEVRGFDVGPPLLPLPRLSDNEREALDRSYRQITGEATTV